MSTESSKILRSGRVLTNTSQHTPIESTTENLNLNMENSTNSSDEINQSGRSSPTNENTIQQINEERLNHLQNEISTLKLMMEKLITQNEERNRQNGGFFATSSFAVGTSNIVTEVNRTRRNQQSHFNDEEDEVEEDYNDTPSNSRETALLNTIQDLPRKLRKTNTKLL